MAGRGPERVDEGGPLDRDPAGPGVDDQLGPTDTRGEGHELTRARRRAPTPDPRASLEHERRRAGQLDACRARLAAHHAGLERAVEVRLGHPRQARIGPERGDEGRQPRPGPRRREQTLAQLGTGPGEHLGEALGPELEHPHPRLAARVDPRRFTFVGREPRPRRDRVEPEHRARAQHPGPGLLAGEARAPGDLAVDDQAQRLGPVAAAAEHQRVAVGVVADDDGLGQAREGLGGEFGEQREAGPTARGSGDRHRLVAAWARPCCRSRATARGPDDRGPAGTVEADEGGVAWSAPGE